MAQNALGAITVTSPGTRVKIDLSTRNNCQSILLQALSNASHTNTGRVYIYVQGIRVATLAVPTTNTIPSFSVTVPDAPGGLSTLDYTIDADNSGDGVDASFARP
jgi:hypothetical protein